MGFFDIFKKKKVEESSEVSTTPEVAQQIEQEEQTEQEELNSGLEKTKEGFFSKLHRAVLVARP